MKTTIVANSLWSVIVYSTFLSKGILILASLALIICFFIFIYKLLLLREKRRQIIQAQASIETAEKLDDILALGSILRATLPGVVLSRGLMVLKQLLSDRETKKLHDQDFLLLQDALNQSLQEVMHHEHEYVSILAVTAAVAPLVGLFGTVSGLIQAFIAIGQTKSADIAAIAPGIAEALLTTFAGLVAAIPALILYHYLNEKINSLEEQLYALTHRFEWVIKKVFRSRKDVQWHMQSDENVVQKGDVQHQNLF
jgi:biopolymer transport protein ExbB/TolQ